MAIRPSCLFSNNIHGQWLLDRPRNSLEVSLGVACDSAAASLLGSIEGAVEAQGWAGRGEGAVQYGVTYKSHCLSSSSPRSNAFSALGGCLCQAVSL